MALVGKVQTIVSTPYTGARLKAKVALKALKAKALMRSQGNRLQGRQGLGTPGFDTCTLLRYPLPKEPL